MVLDGCAWRVGAKTEERDQEEGGFLSNGTGVRGMVTTKISQVRGGVAWSERGFARPIIGRRKGGTSSWRRVSRKDQLYSQLVRNDRLTPSTDPIHKAAFSTVC